MLIKDTKVDKVMNAKGGVGEVTMEHYIDEKLINDKIVMYAKVTINPGCCLGYHQHVGNCETIVVLSGTAEYNDMGVKSVLHVGDTVFCADGDWHQIGNSADSTEPLVLQALVAAK